MATKNTNVKFQNQQQKKNNKRTRKIFFSFACSVSLAEKTRGRVRESRKLFNISPFHLKNKTHPLKTRYIVKQCSKQQLHGTQESSSYS
ncbi:hypothetical protein GmHk_09G026320 [Glycine max]|nr:hypothetical protein GmHk_09G026320 [Glycine max]